MPDQTHHYDTLQVARNAGDEVVRGAYRYLVQKWHPDRNGHRLEEAEAQIRTINEAYRVLSDPALRREHDRWIDRRKAERRIADAQAAAAAPPPTWTAKPADPVLSELARSALVDSLGDRHTWWILPAVGVAVLWGTARTLGASPWNLVWALLVGWIFSILCGRVLAMRLRHQDDAALHRRYAAHRSRSRIVALLAVLAIGAAYLGESLHLSESRLLAPLLEAWPTELSIDLDHRRLRPPCAADGDRVAGVLPGTAASLRTAVAVSPPACKLQ